jgi:hypothetical protein
VGAAAGARGLGGERGALAPARVRLAGGVRARRRRICRLRRREPRPGGHGRSGAKTLLARIRPENEPSIAVARALGFTFDFETTGPAGVPVAVYRLVPRG